MRLTGDQYKKFSKILIYAFPSKTSLERMISQQLNERLDSIFEGENLSEIVGDLIEWAESKEKIFQLINAACRQNPENHDLADFFEIYKKDSQTNNGIKINDEGKSDLLSSNGEYFGEIKNKVVVDEEKDNVSQDLIEKKSAFIQALIGGGIGFVLSVIGNYFANLFVEIIPMSPFFIVITILLTIIGIIVGSLNEIKPKYKFPIIVKFKYNWITIFVSIIIVLLGVIVILSGNYLKPPYTIFFIVDATEKMSPIFDNVREQVQIAAQDVKENSRIGLRVYGGDMAQTSIICQKSRMLMQIHDYPQAMDLLDNVLAGIEPNNHSSLTGAVLEVLYSDIKNEKRPVKIVLVTSGLDPLCDPLAGNLLADRVKDIKNVELIIISIGKQSKENTEIFKSYEQAFNGYYLAVDKVEDFPIIIRRLSYYGYGYYPIYYSVQTSE